MNSFNIDDSSSPITDALIAEVMAKHPTDGLSDRSTERAMGKYFDAVHQELAPLCRKFEAENRWLREQLCHPKFKAVSKARSGKQENEKATQ